MANRTVNTNQLTPGTVYMVRGKISYCRMLHKIDGDELRKDNERRRAQNRPEATKPYTTITIKDAMVVRTNPNAPISLIETYARESLYTNKTTGALCFTVENKGREPWFAKHQNDDVMNPNIQQFCPIAELAAGMDVTLVMEVYQSKPNNGVGLQGIIVNEPVKYFTGKGMPDANALASLGLTFTPASAAEMSAGMEERKNMAPVGLEEYEGDNAVMNSAPAPVSQPAGDPYSYQPNSNTQPSSPAQMQPQYASQYMQNQSVSPQPAQVQAQMQNNAQNVAPQQIEASAQVPQGIVMPQYTTDAMPPFTQQAMPQQNVQPGIRYNPNDRNY